MFSSKKVRARAREGQHVKVQDYLQNLAMILYCSHGRHGHVNRQDYNLPHPRPVCIASVLLVIVNLQAVLAARKNLAVAASLGTGKHAWEVSLARGADGNLWSEYTR